MTDLVDGRLHFGPRRPVREGRSREGLQLFVVERREVWGQANLKYRRDTKTQRAGPFSGENWKAELVRSHRLDKTLQKASGLVGCALPAGFFP